MKIMFYLVGFICFIIGGWCLEDGITGIGGAWNFLNWGLVMLNFAVGTESIKGVYASNK